MKCEGEEAASLLRVLNRAMDRTGVSKDPECRALIGDQLIRCMLYPDNCNIYIQSLQGMLLFSKTVEALVEEIDGAKLSDLLDRFNSRVHRN